MSQLELCSLEKKEALVLDGWLAGLPYWSVLIHNSMNLTPQKI